MLDKRLQPVNEHEQAQPYHVNKVPVPSNTFETEVVICIKVTLHAAKQDNDKHQRTQHHVEPVETSQHKEASTVSACT